MNYIEAVRVELSDLYRFRRVAYSVIYSTLRMRYHKSVLGIGWSIMGPLLNYTVIGLIISQVAKFNADNYLVYLVIGSAVFNFMGTGFNLGASAMISNEHYISKIYLPKLIYPLNAVSMEAINLLFTLVVMFVILPIFATLHIGWHTLTIPFSLICVYFFTLGMGTILSVVGVYFRDVAHVLPIVMQALYFFTPIIYPYESAPAMLQKFNQYNPLYMFIELIRKPLYSGTMPPIEHFGIAVVLAVLSVIVGMYVLKKFDNKIVFKL